MATIYEGMFLLDNDAVRASFAQAKATVTDLLKKHGGKTHTARRWGERRLAYKIRHRNRATFLLVHYEIPGANIPGLMLELDINETILRYLVLKVDDVPAEERELSAAEDAAGFTVVEPPSDDVILESDVIFGQRKKGAGEDEESEESFEDYVLDDLQAAGPSRDRD
jgi:small subunit ribosomal protein S6